VSHVVIPPASIVFTVERWAPGIYNELVRRVISAASATPFSVGVTSWWRGPSDNLHAGGSPDSQHLLGLAIDLTPVSGQLLENLSRVGLIAVDERDHIHVQAWPAGVARAAGILDALGL